MACGALSHELRHPLQHRGDLICGDHHPASTRCLEDGVLRCFGVPGNGVAFPEHVVRNRIRLTFQWSTRAAAADRVPHLELVLTTARCS